MVPVKTGKLKIMTLSLIQGKDGEAKREKKSIKTSSAWEERSLFCSPLFYVTMIFYSSDKRQICWEIGQRKWNWMEIFALHLLNHQCD